MQIIIPFGNDFAVKRVIEHRFSIRRKKYTFFSFFFFYLTTLSTQFVTQLVRSREEKIPLIAWPLLIRNRILVVARDGVFDFS